MLHFVKRLMGTTSAAMLRRAASLSTSFAGNAAASGPALLLLDASLCRQLTAHERQVIAEQFAATRARTAPEDARIRRPARDNTTNRAFEAAWFAVGEQLQDQAASALQEDVTMDLHQHQDRLERRAAELSDETYRKYAL